MNKFYSLLTGSLILGASLMVAAPAAMARDDVRWSVSVGSGGHAYPAPVIVQRPVVVHHQAPVIIQRPPVVNYGYYGAPAPHYVYGPRWRDHGYHHGHGYGHGKHYGHQKQKRGHGHGNHRH